MIHAWQSISCLDSYYSLSAGSPNLKDRMLHNTCEWCKFLLSIDYLSTPTHFRILHKAMEGSGYHDCDFQCFHNIHCSWSKLHCILILSRAVFPPKLGNHSSTAVYISEHYIIIIPCQEIMICFRYFLGGNACLGDMGACSLLEFMTSKCAFVLIVNPRCKAEGEGTCCLISKSVGDNYHQMTRIACT